MSCHGCAHEAADICDQRGEHLPSNKPPCQNCIRNQFPTKSPSILRVDNYIEAGDLADQIAKEAFTIRNNQVWLGDRTVGWIFKLADGRKALRTTRNRRKHYMRIYKGWGMCKAVLEFLRESNFDVIQIQIGRTEFLNSDLDEWFKHGVERKFPGYEEQVFLPEKYMTREKQRTWNLPEIIR